MEMGNGGERHMSRWRMAAWAAAALLLLLPLVAGADWTARDYVFAAILLFGSLGAYEAAARKAARWKVGNSAYRAGAGVAIAGAFLLIWVNAAVGLTDSEADLLYLVVVAIGILGAFIARFRPAGMARAMYVTAFAMALVGVGALIAGVIPEHNSVLKILALTVFFGTPFVGSALLFQSAARGETDRGAA